MPRKGEVRRREVLPDPKFHDRMVTKFMNTIMVEGKKSLAERTFYGALDLIQQRTKEEPLAIFKKALDNVKPLVEVRSRRVGGAIAQVPVEVRPARRISLGMRWLVLQARARPEKSMVERLAGELNDAANNAGGHQEARRHASHGGSQQGVRALSLVSRHASPITTRSYPQHRHHGPHRCRQDDMYGAHPLLHRHQL